MRPAVVESSQEFPCPGWNEGINTSAPLIFILRQGGLQIPGSDNYLDVIPCDLVAAGLTLAVHLPEAGSPLLEADLQRFRQILINLIGNAIKFTDRGGVTVDIDAAADGAIVAVRVTDTGIGIEPETLPLIFDEFYQAKGELTRRHGGSGLGLAISQQLAGMMGGRITVTSTSSGSERYSLRNSQFSAACSPVPSGRVLPWCTQVIRSDTGRTHPISCPVITSAGTSQPRCSRIAAMHSEPDTLVPRSKSAMMMSQSLLTPTPSLWVSTTQPHFSSNADVAINTLESSSTRHTRSPSRRL